MPGKHLSDDGRRHVVTLTKAGYSATQIGAFLGVCERTVQRVRVEKGIAQTVQPPLTETEKACAKTLLDDGASYEETARTINRSVRQVRKHFPDMGWTREQCTELVSLRRRYRQVFA